MQLAIFAVLVFLFVACGSGDGEILPEIPPPIGSWDLPHVTTYETIISIAWWGSPLRHERTIEVLRLFEKRNPGIRFVYEYFDFDGYFAHLNARMASGDMWDIFQLGSHYREFMHRILPLDDFIESGIIDISDTSSEIIGLTAAEDTGKIMGLSSGVNAWGIAYDPLMFDQAGVPRPHSQWTWEEFENVAIEISETLQIWGIGHFPADGVVLTQFLAQQGIYFYCPYDRNVFRLDSPEPLVSFLQMRANMVAYGASPTPIEALQITDIENDPFVFYQAAMTYIASNQLISLAYAALDFDPSRELSMVVLPSHPGGRATASVGSSQMFSIANTSQNPEIAASFLCFFANDIDANLILLGERGIPIMNSVRERLMEDADPVVYASHAFVNQIMELADEIGFEPRIGHAHGVMGEIEATINFTTEQVLRGLITPETGAQIIFDFAYTTITGN